MFYQKYARWPGSMDSALATDQEEVFQLLRTLCTDQYLIDDNLLEPRIPVVKEEDKMSTEDGESNEAASAVLVRRAHAQEIVRYGGCELHTISALIGGIAAQEAVKVIAHQFVPINHTYVYNGIASCGATYTL